MGVVRAGLAASVATTAALALVPLAPASAALVSTSSTDSVSSASAALVETIAPAPVSVELVETIAPALVNETRPTTGGSARYGRVLVADRGSWSRKPTRVGFRWLRSGAPIRGATGKRYRPTHLDVGHRIRVQVTVRRPGYAAGTASSVPRLVRHRVPVRRTVTYTVRRRGHVGASMGRFARQAQTTYDDPRGWRVAGVAFRRVRRGGAFTLWLSQASLVPSFSPACSSYWSCRVGPHVIVNADRWRDASPLWNAVGRSLRDYRHFVVNHETGHWLGRKHRGCPAPGAPAPVMMQQSKNLYGCRANPWPTPGELG